MQSDPTTHPPIVVAPSADRLADVCTPACRALIDEHFTPIWNTTGRELRADELIERLPGAAALLTSWRSPSLDVAALNAAPTLRAVGHAAGSVKQLVPREIFNRDVAVFSAAQRIADSVGEYCLAATMSLLRRLPALDAGIRAGAWKNPAVRGLELTGKRIGIVGASSTARAFLRLLAPFRPNVLVYDPYLKDASPLGAQIASLSDVMSCEIVSIHAPATAETEGMISRELLATMADGAILVNSSRGATVDQEALFAEIGRGRLYVALDVYTPEPPQLPEQVLRSPNVLLSPHIAGDTTEGHLALMETVVRDMIGWLERGESGSTRVDGRSWDIAA